MPGRGADHGADEAPGADVGGSRTASMPGFDSGVEIPVKLHAICRLRRFAAPSPFSGVLLRASKDSKQAAATRGHEDLQPAGPGIGGEGEGGGGGGKGGEGSGALDQG